MNQRIYHKENPFLASLSEDLQKRKRIKYQKAVVPDPEDPSKILYDEHGRVVTVKTHPTEVEDRPDTSEYIKLYKSAIPAIKNLRKSGQQMLLYVILHLKPKRDVVFIDAEDAITFIGNASKQTVYEGIGDLINNGIIARSLNGDKLNQVFWVNPAVIFNGSRTVLSPRMDSLIKTEAEYLLVMSEINALMKRGEDNLTEDESTLLSQLVLSASDWEEKHYPL